MVSSSGRRRTVKFDISRPSIWVCDSLLFSSPKRTNHHHTHTPDPWLECPAADIAPAPRLSFRHLLVVSIFVCLLPSFCSPLPLAHFSFGFTFSLGAPLGSGTAARFTIPSPNCRCSSKSHPPSSTLRLPSSPFALVPPSLRSRRVAMPVVSRLDRKGRDVGSSWPMSLST